MTVKNVNRVEVVHCSICEGNETQATVIKLDNKNVCASCYDYITKR